MKKWKRILPIGITLAVLLGLLLILAPVSANPGPTVVAIDAPAEVAPDSDFIARVAINDVTDFDACNYDVTYAPTVLEIIGSEGGADGVTAGLIGATVIPVDVWGFVPSGTPGRIRVIQNVPGVPGVSGSGYLAEIHFHVIGAGGTSSAITLENGCLSDKNAQEIPASWIGSSVRVSVEAPALAKSTTPTPSQPPVLAKPTTLDPFQPPAFDDADIPSVWLVGALVVVAIVTALVVILRGDLRR